MYHSGMNSIWKNKATLFHQRSVIDDASVTNQSNQSIEGFVWKQQRHHLTPNIVVENDNLQ